MRRVSTACALLALSVAACSSPAASAADPESLLLSPSDVDVVYSAEQRDDPEFVMRSCLVGNLGQRIEGAQTASISFDAAAAGDGFAHTVSTTGDRDPSEVLDEIAELVDTCDADTSVSVSDDLVMSTSFTRQLADGPEIGDRAVWMSSQLSVQDSAGISGGDRDPTPTVIFLKDGVLHYLSAPVVLDWGAAVDFIVEHASRI